MTEQSLSQLKSLKLFEEAKTLIPNGVQTLSKNPDRFVKGIYPIFIQSAQGCILEDVDRNLYTDFICSLGAIILGHRNRTVDRLVRLQIEKGTLYSLESPETMHLAKMLNHIIPCAKMVKFFKTGSEATSAAVKVARAYTGKDKVLVCGYHGWHDWYTICNDKKAGIPKILEGLCLKFKYNDLESLKQYFEFDDIAAVIMEPVVYEEPKNNFLEEVKRITHEHGALLIFDEMVTGFRLSLSGAQGYFNIIPDLCTVGKALGNGYAIAALAGFTDYMKVYERDDFFISGTYGGDLIGIAAAVGTIDCLQEKDEKMIKTIWSNGQRLKDGFNSICKILSLENIKCDGYPPRTIFNFPTVEHKALFWQECVKNNVLFGYANFICSAHTEIVMDNTLGACEIALRVVKDAWNDPKSRLEGSVPVEVFRLR